MRHWIKGPKAGTSELQANLPGYPDNVRADGKGGFWAALKMGTGRVNPSGS